jgi:hypothetical protein
MQAPKACVLPLDDTPIISCLRAAHFDLVGPENTLLYHLPGNIVQGMDRIPKRPILHFFARHGDKNFIVTLDHFNIPHDETIVKYYRRVRLYPLLFNGENLDIRDQH